MVYYDVVFGEGGLSNSLHKSAIKKLQAVNMKDKKIQSVMSQQEFIRFKRMLELYLKTLKLDVLIPQERANEAGELEPMDPIRRSFHLYCRTQGKRPLDLLIDDYDVDKMPSDAETSDKIFLRLSDDVDDVVADDVLSLSPLEIDFLSSFAGQNRTHHIVRRLGSSFYLALDSQRQLNYRNLAAISWGETTSILTFNHKFQLAIAACNELQLQTQVIDQIVLYLDKVKENRGDNNVLLAASNIVKTSDCVSLPDAMSRVASLVLHQNPSGCLPFDGPTVHYMTSRQPRNGNKAPRNNNPPRKNGNGNGQRRRRELPCFYCGEHSSNIGDHLKRCSGLTSTCTTCKEYGHAANACVPYRTQRIKRDQKKKAALEEISQVLEKKRKGMKLRIHGQQIRLILLLLRTNITYSKI